MYLVCGEALFDIFLKSDQAPGSLQLEARAGGSPFNVAIGITRQGGCAGLLTGASNDLLGARPAAMLEVEYTRYLVRSGRRTILSPVDPTGDCPEYVFYGLGSVDCSLEARDLPELDDTIDGNCQSRRTSCSWE